MSIGPSVASVGFFGLLVLVFNLAMFVFLIYVLVSFVRFMKTKTENDEAMLQTMDRLIQLYEKGRNEIK